MSTANTIASIVNEWFQTLPTPAEQQRDRSALIRDLLAEVKWAQESAALAERVRIVDEVRRYAETVRFGTNDSVAGNALTSVIGAVADRINTLADPAA
jgi:hypothetical protein